LYADNYEAELYANHNLHDDLKDSLYFNDFDISSPKYFRVILQETLQTFIFTFVFLMVKYKQSLKKSDEVVKGLLLSLVLYCCYEMALQSGQSFNPAFAAAESVFMFVKDKKIYGNYSRREYLVWVYLIFPIVGSVIASLVFILHDKFESKNIVELEDKDE
jgi:glycerol uptake facilitator-like aquaporin